jgi:hypothetical protein
VAVDVEKFRKDLTQKLDAYEKENRDKEGWSATVFGNKKADAVNDLNRQLEDATNQLAAKVEDLGKEIGTKIESAINKASPKLTALAEYGYCKDQFDPGKPGWSHVGKLGISGVNEFSASGKLELGPLDISISFSVPGFAELSVSGKLNYSITGSVSGSLTPDTPTTITPANRPSATAVALVDLPITGELSAEAKTGIIGTAGDLGLTVNERIGPVELKYKAKEK